MSIQLIPITKWFPVFRSGTHTDSEGRVREWTESDIDRIIELNEGNLEDVRAVLGHPKGDAPSYGKTAGLKKVVRNGVTYLFAQLKDVVHEFFEFVNAGQYDRVSISLRDDMTLRHIGFLGGTPPAVKGLPTVSFSEEKYLRYEFSDFEDAGKVQVTFEDMLRMFKGIRDYLIEKEGREAADAVIPLHMVEWIQSSIESMKDNTQSHFSQNPGGSMPKTIEELHTEVEQLTANLNAANTKISEYSEEVSTLKSQNESLTTEVKNLKSEARRVDFRSFAEKLVSDGKITPAMVDVAVGLMDSMSDADEYQFSESVKKSPLEAFKNLLGTGKNGVSFGEVTKDGHTPTELSAQELSDKAIEYRESVAKSGRTISISEAVEYVKKSK